MELNRNLCNRYRSRNWTKEFVGSDLRGFQPGCSTDHQSDL